MSCFVKLTEAIADRGSLLVTGLDPNPEMLQSWSRREGLSAASFLAVARQWIKSVIEATSDHVCAYKPSLGFYQALGPIGLDLLREVRELVPLEIPLILDAKHGDLNSSSALARHWFEELLVDAVTLMPLAGQDIAAPFLLFPGKAVVISCHSSNPGARVLQHHPNDSDPFYLRLVRESQLWATPDQLMLEVGTTEPALLATVRRMAPSRVMLLRSLWGVEERLPELMEAGLSDAADGLLLPLPQNLLVEENLSERAAALKREIAGMQGHHGTGAAQCELWLPEVRRDPSGLDQLLLDLFDIGCLLFGAHQQASGAVFNHYIDLRQIISDPNLFHRVLHAYAHAMQDLPFDRVAGIPYGSLPTATGLSLQLHKPLIYPRKEVKAHGARRLIEGDFEEGDRVLLVDDILISGGSMLDGIAKLEQSGLVVSDVVVFLDHGSGGRERVEAAGYRVHAVSSLPHLGEVLEAAGRLTPEQTRALRH
jgi:uridine monophosphate synthetase